jgi:hypothetical protein
MTPLSARIAAIISLCPVGTSQPQGAVNDDIRKMKDKSGKGKNK